MSTTLIKPAVDIKADPDICFARVLDRLNGKPDLISGTLRQGDNFCVIGILADESGLGEWNYNNRLDYYEYCDPATDHVIDYEDIVGYYGINMHVDLLELPEQIQEKLAVHYGFVSPSELARFSIDVPLWRINDSLVNKGGDIEFDLLCNILEYLRQDPKTEDSN